MREFIWLRDDKAEQSHWEKIRAVDKLPPWCDRILGCPPPYNDIGEQDAGRSSTDKTTWSWPYNENGKKIQLGDHGRALLKEHHLRPHNERASAAGARANSFQRANSLEQRQAALRKLNERKRTAGRLGANPLYAKDKALDKARAKI